MSNVNLNIDQIRKDPWLALVGIGEDGVEGLSRQARVLIETAEVVFGGTRHLSLAASLIRGSTRPWSSPFDHSIAEVLAQRGRPVCVLASGDPFQYGVGAVLARQVEAEEMVAVPALSAFGLAASRLHWSLPQTTLLSLCGRSTDLLRPHLQPGARILALTSDADAPAAIAGLLCIAGFGRSKLTVLESLAGPDERVRTGLANSLDLQTRPNALNTVGIEVVAEPGARVLPRTPGLADELFEHDGQITKREIRAVTLSCLAPRRGELLWDVGAGSGSISIEWMLADTSLRAVAIERRSDRVERIRRNAASLGVPDLRVLEGIAPDALAGLPSPNAIFIGGGARAEGLVELAQSALLPGGRLVINAVTLESESALVGHRARAGGTLARLDISRADALGVMSGWRPARPVTQWTWVKP
jgi:precorrin-6Y C5,15-methyltransferase (decarboxylating)